MYKQRGSVGAKELELRLYDKLFTEAQMGQIPEGQDYKTTALKDSFTF